QQGGAGPPVADDEDRRVGDRRSANGVAVEKLLKPAQKRVKHADESNDDGNVEVPPGDGKAIADEDARPREEIAAFPHAWRPLGFWCGTFLCLLRHRGLGSLSQRELAGLLHVQRISMDLFWLFSPLPTSSTDWKR